jgi:hypothetical protein
MATINANGRSDARRARQALLIHSWRPWRSSTGPKTAAGKAASSRNAAAAPGSVRQQINAIAAEVKAVRRLTRRAIAHGK